jgi:hypothetical protein
MLKLLIARMMVNSQKKKLFPVEYLEQKHVDLSQPYPNDSSYFYGSDKDNNAFIARMAFRGPEREHEYWFDFHLNGKGFYGLKEDPGPDGPGHQMGNLKWEPVEIGKKWAITYEGQVTGPDGKKHACKTDLLFTGDHGVYDFARSSDRGMIAKAFASVKWNKEFFFKMKDAEQTHYEQTGKITGSICLDGEKHDVDFRASRDHSFGSRTWTTWDRHYWITGISDNGYHWTVTTIRWNFLPRLTAGFITAPDGTTDAIVDCTDLETISKDKLLPDQGTIDIYTRGKKHHKLEFWRHGHFPYLMDGKYQMREGIGTYRFDGSEGLGMVEFGFHSDLYKID